MGSVLSPRGALHVVPPSREVTSAARSAPRDQRYEVSARPPPALAPRPGVKGRPGPSGTRVGAVHVAPSVECDSRIARPSDQARNRLPAPSDAPLGSGAARKGASPSAIGAIFAPGPIVAPPSAETTADMRSPSLIGIESTPV